MEKNIDIYNKKENCNIKSKIFYNEENKIEKEIFIFCHGFCSGKGSNSVKIVANKLLQYGVPSISFDFPGHIDSVQGTDKLTVDVCISYIDAVVEYVKNMYGKDIKISFFAISFGAYILLNKLITDNSEYTNIVLRSPAFNMKDILINSLLKEPFEQYKKNGKAKCGHGGKIEVPYAFYEDLIKNNLYNNYHEKRKILIIEMKNMKHHMEPEEIESVVEKMIEKIKL